MGTTRTRSLRGAALAALCLILGAAAGLEGFRSQSSFSTLRWRGLALMTAEGKVCLLHSNTAPAGPDRNGFHTVPYSRTAKGAKGAPIVQWPNFGYSWPTDPGSGERKLTAVAPLWFVAAAFCLHPLWWLSRGRHAARIADEMD